MKQARALKIATMFTCIWDDWDRDERHKLPQDKYIQYGDYLSRHFAFAALVRKLLFKTETSPEYISVYIHPALIPFRSEHSRIALAVGMSSDWYKHFSSRLHVDIQYKNYYDRHEIVPV